MNRNIFARSGRYNRCWPGGGRRVSKTAFLSSTGADLRAYREAAFQQIQKLDGWKCIRMENSGRAIRMWSLLTGPWQGVRCVRGLPGRKGVGEGKNGQM